MRSTYDPLLGRNFSTQPIESQNKVLGLISVVILICLSTLALICSQQHGTTLHELNLEFNDSYMSIEERNIQSDTVDEQSNKELIEEEKIQQSFLRSHPSESFSQGFDEDNGNSEIDIMFEPLPSLSSYSYFYLETEIYSYSFGQTNSPTFSPTLTSDTLPNIVFYLADDQGFADLGYRAESPEFNLFTPYIDTLIQDSIALGFYYTQYQCTPARSALMTGKYPIHNGMQYLVVDDDSPFGLPLTHKTLAQHLSSIGYKTHVVGKWHLGHFNEHYLPLARGFRSHLGYYTGECGYYTHKIEQEDIWFTDFHRDGNSLSTDKYSLAVYMNEVQNILKNHDTAHPFFLYYAQQAPHSPMDSPPVELVGEDIFKAAKTLFPDEERRRIFAEISSVLDLSLQDLIEQLKENNMYENTVVIYASDNGGCTYFGGNNYPLRGQKNRLYEGGVRVNAFIHSPLIPENLRGSSFDKLFHVVDWLPTILNGIIGLETVLPDLDGIDQWGNILGNSDDYRTEMMHNIEVHATFPNTFRAAVHVGSYKLIYGEYDSDWFTSTTPSTCMACCETLTGAFPRRTMVFDIGEDESEKDNLLDKIDDSILSMLWQKLDGYWDTMVRAAYKSDDDDALTVWKQNDMYVVPWMADPKFR